MRERRPVTPVIILFVMLTAFFIVGRQLLERYGFDQSLLIWGNLLLFGITLLSYALAMRGLKSPNPHAFMRSIYSSILLKLFICMIAAFAYIAMHRSKLNKPAFFTLMALYLVYTFLEVSVLTKQLRSKSNG